MTTKCGTIPHERRGWIYVVVQWAKGGAIPHGMKLDTNSRLACTFCVAIASQVSTILASQNRGSEECCL